MRTYNSMHAIAHRRGAKVALYDVRAHLCAAEITSHSGHHSLAAGGPTAADGVRFHPAKGGVQELIGVEVGAVRRQKDQADLLSVSLNPPLHLGRFVHRVLIYDQIDPTPRAAHQPSQKLDEHIAGEAFFEHHEPQRAAIGNRRDHVESPPLPGARNDGGVSFVTVRCAGLMVASKPHLVSPVDFRPFGQGLPPNTGIAHLEPTLHRRGVLFPRPAHRFLGRESPPLQPPTDRHQRHLHPESPLHQSGHRFSRPQDKGELELVGSAVGNRTDDLRRLPPFEPTMTFSSPPRAGSQRLPTPLSIRRHPLANRRPRHPKHADRFYLFHPAQNRLHDMQANVLLGFRRKEPSISCFHSMQSHHNAHKLSTLSCSP